MTAGRGRPATLTPAKRSEYLTAVTDGMSYKDAAAHVGVTPRAVQLAATADPQFATARKDARDKSRTARADRVPHGLYRYVHFGCRCPICRKHAATQRANCPDRTHKEAAVLPMKPPTDPNPPAEPGSFVLARVS